MQRRASTGGVPRVLVVTGGCAGKQRPRPRWGSVGDCGAAEGAQRIGGVLWLRWGDDGPGVGERGALWCYPENCCWCLESQV